MIKELRKPYYTNKNKKYKKYDIGDYTYGKPKIYAEPSLFKLGKFYSITDGVTIYGGEHHYDRVSSYNFSAKFSCIFCTTSKGKVTIGNDVWFADGVLILSRVTMDDGSVVSKDLKPYEIVGGNPAKHIKFRFSESQINYLLEIKWWNWDIEKIKAEFDLILSPNIDDFISKYKEK